MADPAPLAPPPTATGVVEPPGNRQGTAPEPQGNGQGTTPKDSSASAPGRLTLIGAGHVFRIQETIRGAIQALRPDVVFVELDRGRLHALIERSKGNKPPPAGGFVHRRLAKFQEGVAGMYGAHVGSEMLGAVLGARDVGARLSLIDDAAEDTLRRAMRQLTFREKMRFVGMVLGAGFKSLWPANRRRGKADIERELARYQADPQALLGEVQRKFPTLHRVLIAERDAKMAARIRTQLAGARHGVAVLGDGHVGGMLQILQDLRPTVFRLAAVREGRLPKPVPVATGTSTSVGFTVEWPPRVSGAVVPVPASSAAAAPPAPAPAGGKPPSPPGPKSRPNPAPAPTSAPAPAEASESPTASAPRTAAAAPGPPSKR